MPAQHKPHRTQARTEKAGIVMIVLKKKFQQGW
jgi:hypothetical protein